jgi:hypothetical protein
MAEPFDQIGAAIPFGALLRVGLELAAVQEQEIPAGQEPPDVERKAGGT